jgi:hypothetical protein
MGLDEIVKNNAAIARITKIMGYDQSGQFGEA